MDNKKNVAIYNLNNPFFLYEDVEAALDDISNLYDVKFGINQIEYISKIFIPKEIHWVSDKSVEIFNKSIPKIKSITKDMYSIIEGIFKARKGNFDKLNLERQYPNLRELRLFNNKLKHHENRDFDINLTKIAMLGESGHLMDCFLQFKNLKTNELSLVRFANLINVFFIILETEEIITIDRSNSK